MVAPVVVCEIAFATAPTEAPTWVDVSAYLREFSIDRGRRTELNQVDTGTASVVLDNADRRFDSTHATGPYSPNVRPRRRLRLRASHGGVTYPLFDGFTKGFPQHREGYGDQYVALSAYDALGVLSRFELNASLPLQKSGERVAAVLDLALWSTGNAWRLDVSAFDDQTILGPVGDRALDGGQSDVSASDLAAANAMGHLQTVAETENGLLFTGRDGAVVFHDRRRRMAVATGTPRGTFGDNLVTGELPYVDVEWSDEDDRLFNDVRVAREGGAEQVAQDAASQAEYFPSTLRRATLHTTDAEALDAANYLLGLHKDPQLRISGLTIDPKDGTDRIWPHLLGAELGDLYSVRATPLGGGSRITQLSFLEATHLGWIAKSEVWAGQWVLSPADTQQFWFLDVSAFDEQTRLAY
jgi:hypothetical protein